MLPVGRANARDCAGLPTDRKTFRMFREGVEILPRYQGITAWPGAGQDARRHAKLATFLFVLLGLKAAYQLSQDSCLPWHQNCLYSCREKNKAVTIEIELPG